MVISSSNRMKAALELLYGMEPSVLPAENPLFFEMYNHLKAYNHNNVKFWDYPF